MVCKKLISLLVPLSVALCALGIGSAPAFAEGCPAGSVFKACAPGYEVTGNFGPTNLPPGGVGNLKLYVFNTGAVPGTEGPTLIDKLPPGLEAVAEVPAGVEGVKAQESAECSGTGSEVTCRLGPLNPGTLASNGSFWIVYIPVRVSAGASNESAPVDTVSVRGGGALGVTNAMVPVHYRDQERGWGSRPSLAGPRMPTGPWTRRPARTHTSSRSHLRPTIGMS